MKIVVFTTLFPNAAQPHHGTFVEKRLSEMRDRYAIDAVVVAPVPWFPKMLQRYSKHYAKFANVPLVEVRYGLKIYHPRYFVAPKISWRFAAIFMAIGARNLLKRLRAAGFNFDLIDAHFMFPDGVAAVLIGNNLGIPVCTTCRGSDINESSRHFIPRIFLRWALVRARAVVCVSRELSDKVFALTDGIVRPEVLPNGVDRRVFYPRDNTQIKKALGLKSNVVLTVGNLRKLKGHAILINAVSKLDGVSLVIVGEGEEEGALRRLVDKYDNRVDVIFAGSVANDELPEYYSAADVFALASENEGCPNVVLEAIACGTPVVATRVGAIPELVPASHLDFLVAERTAEAFADRIRYCLDNRRAAGGILEHADSLSWSRTCSRLIKVFRTAVNGKMGALS